MKTRLDIKPVSGNLVRKSCIIVLMTNSSLLREVLAKADVRLNGDRPWDITTNDIQAFSNSISGGTLGIGEAFVDGLWDCKEIDELIDRLYRARLDTELEKRWVLIGSLLLSYLGSFGSRRKTSNVAEHYNLGNDLFQAMLDPRLVYTCGYWKDTDSLVKAQEQKLDLVCRKVGLEKGMRVLDIGGGWGGFVKYAAEKYGTSAVNISVSKEQIELADKLCKGLPVENRLADYREINEPFDAIVSLGMFEHVGPKNHRSYMEVVNRCLKEGGLFLLHTIGSNISTNRGNPWVAKYIFGGVVPSLTQITGAIEGLFILEDVHNFGPDYDKTLMAWWDNFDKNWPKLCEHYGDRFYRMWKLYLQSCAGAFRARNLQLWQIVLSKNGVDGGYSSIR